MLTQPSVQWALGFFLLWLKRPRSEAYHSIPSNTKINNEWSQCPDPPLCFHGLYRRAILPFFCFADLNVSDLKSFRFGQFSSQGLIKRTEIMCSEKVQEFENRNFSRNRVTEPISNTASYLRCKLRSSSKIVPAHSRAVDESRDVNYCSVWQCLFAGETKILL